MISLFKRLALLAIILSGVIALTTLASTPKPPDVPRDYVIDLAGIFKNNSWHQLNQSLKELEKRTTAQVIEGTLRNLRVKSFSLHVHNHEASD